MKKALDRRLSKQANRQRTRYNVKEVQQIVPSADPNFQPSNPVIPNRVIPVLAPTPPTPASLRAETAPGSNPFRLVIHLPENHYLNHPQAPQYSPEVLAEMRRMEYDEDDEDDDFVEREKEVVDVGEKGDEGILATQVEDRGNDGDEVPAALTTREKRAKKIREAKSAVSFDKAVIYGKLKLTKFEFRICAGQSDRIPRPTTEDHIDDGGPLLSPFAHSKREGNERNPRRDLSFKCEGDV